MYMLWGKGIFFFFKQTKINNLMYYAGAVSYAGLQLHMASVLQLLLL